MFHVLFNSMFCKLDMYVIQHSIFSILYYHNVNMALYNLTKSILSKLIKCCTSSLLMVFKFYTFFFSSNNVFFSIFPFLCHCCCCFPCVIFCCCTYIMHLRQNDAVFFLLFFFRKISDLCMSGWNILKTSKKEKKKN